MEGSVRAWARSRSLRDDDENNKLRFGLAGAGSAAAAPAGYRPARVARGVASPCQGGGEDADDGAAGSIWPGFSDPDGSRPKKPLFSAA